MTKILIIEDEESVRKPLADHLAREGYQVAVAQSGREADEKLSPETELIVADWMLPDVQGIELLKKWRSRGISIPVIMLTARADLVDKVLGLEFGANDYMTKPFEVRELVARIRAHLRAKNFAPHGPKRPESIQAGDIFLSPSLRETRLKNQVIETTKTEFDLLKLFIENPNQVFSREEILKKVWGYENYPTTRTVDTHVLQLRQKFGNDRFETVHKIGYRFRLKT